MGIINEISPNMLLGFLCVWEYAIMFAEKNADVKTLDNMGLLLCHDLI